MNRNVCSLPQLEDKDSLLGLHWLNTIPLNWHSIFKVDSSKPKEGLAKLVAQHEDIFNEALSTVNASLNRTATLFLKPDNKPQICPPFALKLHVKQEIQRLVYNNTLEKG